MPGFCLLFNKYADTGAFIIVATGLKFLLGPYFVLLKHQFWNQPFLIIHVLLQPK